MDKICAGCALTIKDVPNKHLKRINKKGIKGIWACSDCLQIEDDLIERHEGEVLYVHAANCPSFCDFACNGEWGKTLADYVTLREPTDNPTDVGKE